MKKLFIVLFLLIITQINAQCWQSISALKFHRLALKTEGTLWSWGSNQNGQLGDGTYIDKNVPTQIGTATNWQSISGGEGHSLGVKTDGTLWTWGDNNYGQLGDGTNINKYLPTQIGTATNWQSVSGGNRHSLGVKTDGTLWTWGDNNDGQLGDGTNLGKNVPTQIGTATNWQSVSGAVVSAAAIKTDGTLWTWGWNFFGQLGDGTNLNKNIPTQINCPTSVIGFEEISFNSNLFSIYPNPANNILNIKNTENKTLASIIILDVLGRKVLEQKENTSQINIKDLEKGMYQVILFSGDNSYSSKFIKE